jgi:adenylate kinase family enzyme
VGCPGAGKSTFARAISKKSGIPVIHLDYYYHQKKFDFGNNKQAWLDKIAELTSGDSWIIEGNYSSSYEQRIPVSDTLIFLDMPPWLSVWSVLKRRFQYSNKGRAEMPADWVERINLEFFKYVVMFNIKSRKNITNGISKYNHENLNVLTFKKRKDAYKWLRTFNKVIY